jgi:hypothetical protein
MGPKGSSHKKVIEPMAEILTIDMPTDLNETECKQNNFTSTKRKYVEC